VSPLVTVSVVSHRQNDLVNQLGADLERHCRDRIAVIVTQNVADSEPLKPFTFPVEVVVNPAPKGFGANHNAAFRRCHTPYFCVMNPDVRLPADPFATLALALSDSRVGVVGPVVRNPGGKVEDSARRFPTLRSLVQKLFVASPAPDYRVDGGATLVDWIAGMCMLFRSESFAAAKGFDERYFLYYEDVDICRRLHGLGLGVMYEPRVEVVHDARRSSRRDPRYALHHARSIIRYFLS
jgi:N-acetylglucosaminyl-diphospho-decaprenol L-rhamnosyltransferase